MATTRRMREETVRRTEAATRAAHLRRSPVDQTAPPLALPGATRSPRGEASTADLEACPVDPVGDEDRVALVQGLDELGDVADAYWVGVPAHASADAPPRRKRQSNDGTHRPAGPSRWGSCSPRGRRRRWPVGGVLSAVVHRRGPPGPCSADQSRLRMFLPGCRHRETGHEPGRGTRAPTVWSGPRSGCLAYARGQIRRKRPRRLVNRAGCFVPVVPVAAAPTMSPLMQKSRRAGRHVVQSSEQCRPSA